MIDFTRQDGFDYTSCDVESLIADARAGRLGANNRRFLVMARAQRIERAAEITNAAVGECRALVPEETRRVDGLVAEARALEPVIAELLEADRRELTAAVAAYAPGEPLFPW